jgi:hypothetical protein
MVRDIFDSALLLMSPGYPRKKKSSRGLLLILAEFCASNTSQLNSISRMSIATSKGSGIRQVRVRGEPSAKRDRIGVAALDGQADPGSSASDKNGFDVHGE